ncbi:MAG TPA: subclass B3 metallo-beta-lactamase [Gemmatimonadaceae bacterium]|nr:subclass B3 metallo-beta-lactamase [Gemmatimonadaceae bacterium]
MISLTNAVARGGFVAIAVLALPLLAQTSDTAPARRDKPCASCAEWNVPQRPFRLYGNTYFIGTHGLSAILIVSRDGHVLIDGGLPESAARIIADIRALGFRIEDVKLIVNSHAHFDHAGGIAELQRASGATVAASPWSARVLSSGTTGREDPQYGIVSSFPPAHDVEVIADGDTLRVGAIVMTAHFTPGHTPGGTSWSWRSCDGKRCLDFVYADSQTPVSADDFYFTRSTTYPSAIADFERGFATLERLRCDVLVTPHPDASSLWERVAARDSGRSEPALEDPSACKRYAANAREQLARRIAKETGKL